MKLQNRGQDPGSLLSCVVQIYTPGKAGATDKHRLSGLESGRCKCVKGNGSESLTERGFSQFVSIIFVFTAQ